MKHKKRTDAEKIELVRLFQNKGSQSGAAFMKEHKLSNSIVYTWVKKFGGGKAGPAPTQTIDYKGVRIYLSHAKREMNQALVSGRLKELDPAHLYTLLALTVLEGKR